MSKNPNVGARRGNTNAQIGDSPTTSQLQVRCTSAEKALWVHAAKGGKLSDWVRNVLNAAAKTTNGDFYHGH